jgi:DNA-binding transcriptional ArsR family regulator
MPAPTRTKVVIDEPRHIRLLASPLRQRILDLVTFEGPQTVAELSRALRRPPDRLYYHIKKLAAAGILVPRDDGVNGSSGVRFDVAGRPVYLHYEPKSAANRRAVIGVADGILRAARREFRRGFAPGVEANGARRRLWAARVEGLLTPTDLEEINGLFARVIEIMMASRNRRRPNALPHQLTWISSPRAEP